jgi:hypothetical protein
MTEKQATAIANRNTHLKEAETQLRDSVTQIKHKLFELNIEVFQGPGATQTTARQMYALLMDRVEEQVFGQNVRRY